MHFNKNELVICEIFYSIQGEGPSAGKPALFLRLAGCNLTCKKLGCDTAAIWKKGRKFSTEEILNIFTQKGWLENLAKGAHLVITGGEPLLQQNSLIYFLSKLKDILGSSPFTEIETNATCIIKDELLNLLHQINASPKLTSTGNIPKIAYQTEILEKYVQNSLVKFKFVLQSREDFKEVMAKYIKKFNIETNRIWLMPAGTSSQTLKNRSQWIVELCKKHLINYSPRIHINIWGNVKGF